MSSTELLFAKAVVALIGMTLIGLGLAAGRLVLRGAGPRDAGVEEPSGGAETGFGALAALTLLSLALLGAGLAILLQPGLFSPAASGP